ncbi:MAG: hypothetical protein U0K19_01620 [Bifidobacteriaceae bacterium]|nr:hypothetical protein [Bifidobacteriaceae bacterium]
MTILISSLSSLRTIKTTVTTRISRSASTYLTQRDPLLFSKKKLGGEFIERNFDDVCRMN